MYIAVLFTPTQRNPVNGRSNSSGGVKAGSSDSTMTIEKGV